MKHGGKYAYEQRCRCEVCIEAWNGRHRELRARRAAVAAARTDITHGTIGTYRNHGCRCEACYRAQSEANRRRPSRAKAAR